MSRLAAFVRDLDSVVTRSDDERAILAEATPLLARLVSVDDWLPDSHARADAEHYRQYLLHRDPAGRFSIVSFVWGPGQATPIHDHTIWGLVGVLRGGEVSERYAADPNGLRLIARDRLNAGAVEAVSPTVGDIHRVANAHDNRVSISIHVYGADIGTVERHMFDEDGGVRRFVSGYADAPSLDLLAA